MHKNAKLSERYSVEAVRARFLAKKKEKGSSEEKLVPLRAEVNTLETNLEGLKNQNSAANDDIQLVEQKIETAKNAIEECTKETDAALLTVMKLNSDIRRTDHQVIELESGIHESEKNVRVKTRKLAETKEDIKGKSKRPFFLPFF